MCICSVSANRRNVNYIVIVQTHSAGYTSAFQCNIPFVVEICYLHNHVRKVGQDQRGLDGVAAYNSCHQVTGQVQNSCRL